MGDDSQRVARFKEDIVRRFADVPAPRHDGITYADDWETQALQKAFAGQDWRTVSPQLIRQNYDQLPLFTPEAFRFFLPAYLLHAVGEAEDSPVREYTLYALTPGKETESGTRW